MPRKRWVKLWTQESLYGSISRELEPEERWAWIGLLLLAGDSIEPGKVCAAPDIPWTDDQLAGILKIPKETWLSAKEKMLKHDKIREDGDGILHIVNWEKYQGGFDKAEYMREYMSEYRKTGRKTNSKTNKSKINSKTSQSDQNRTEQTKSEKKQNNINSNSPEEERIWIEVIKEKDVKAITKTKLMDHIAQLREEYSDVDFDSELRKFRLYYSDSNRKLRKPRLALTNWMEKARREAGERQTRRNQPAREEPHEWA